MNIYHRQRIAYGSPAKHIRMQYEDWFFSLPHIHLLSKLRRNYVTLDYDDTFPEVFRIMRGVG